MMVVAVIMVIIVFAMDVVVPMVVLVIESVASLIPGVVETVGADASVDAGIPSTRATQVHFRRVAGHAASGLRSCCCGFGRRRRFPRRQIFLRPPLIPDLGVHSVDDDLVGDAVRLALWRLPGLVLLRWRWRRRRG